MILYEITNSPVPFTLEAPDREIAAVAIFVLGEGRYGLEPVDSAPGLRVPSFLFGGANEWTLATFRMSFAQLRCKVEAERCQDLVDCLESCLIGRPSERRDYNAAMARLDSQMARDALRASRRDRGRSALVDLGGRAVRLAAQVRQENLPASRPPVAARA